MLRARAREQAPPAEGVWIADTLGELGLWYRLAPIAFVGRSLVPPGGGQNPLEPARLGCAIAVGPHTGNFADHVAMLRDGRRADRGARTRRSWRAGWMTLLRDPARRRGNGRGGARRRSQRHGDLPQRTAAALLELLPPAG